MGRKGPLPQSAVAKRQCEKDVLQRTQRGEREQQTGPRRFRAPCRRGQCQRTEPRRQSGGSRDRQRQRELLDDGYPLLAGWSRKSSLAAVTQTSLGNAASMDVDQRRAPSITAAVATSKGGLKALGIAVLGGLAALWAGIKRFLGRGKKS